MTHVNERERVLVALEKDINRRYISVGHLQSDGRLELDKACIDILQPKEGEAFSLLDDKSSIILVRNPAPTAAVIAVVKWDETKKRLRLPPSALRILLACSVGIRVFMYNGSVALEIEPYLQPPDSSLFFETETIEQLATYVLRSPRSIQHIDIISNTTFIEDEVYFRLAGEYWERPQHQDPFDENLDWILCTGKNCKACEDNYPIVSRTIWFPALTYNAQMNPRPALLSFRIPRARTVCDPIITECTHFAIASKESGYERYCDRGTILYNGRKMFKLACNDDDDHVSIVHVDNPLLNRSFTVEEKGLLKLALKELQTYIVEFENQPPA
jgi:hypothetical protein